MRATDPTTLNGFTSPGSFWSSAALSIALHGVIVLLGLWFGARSSRPPVLPRTIDINVVQARAEVDVREREAEPPPPIPNEPKAASPPKPAEPKDTEPAETAQLDASERPAVNAGDATMDEATRILAASTDTTPGLPVIQEIKRPVKNPSSRSLSSPDSSAEAARAQYKARVAARIHRKYHYPAPAKRHGIQGVVLARVTILKSGQIGSVTIVRGSSLSYLPEAARRMIESAAPFPPVPDSVGRRFTFDIPIRFELEIE